MEVAEIGVGLAAGSAAVAEVMRVAVATKVAAAMALSLAPEVVATPEVGVAVVSNEVEEAAASIGVAVVVAAATTNEVDAAVEVTIAADAAVAITVAVDVEVAVAALVVADQRSLPARKRSSGMSSLLLFLANPTDENCRQDAAPVPAPDATITELEDKILQSHLNTLDITNRMSKLQVSSTKGRDGSSSENHFPCRPAFGTNGKNVVLWANYFKLSVAANALSTYAIEVTPVKKENTKAQPRDAKGRKLRTIVKTALQQVGQGVPLVSEFKSQVVSMKPLSLPGDNSVTVKYTIENKDDEYKVVFNGPGYIDLAQLLNYLSTMQDPTGDTSFPKFETAIDALSVIIGHSARESDLVSALGRSRYFPLDRNDQQFDLGPNDYNTLIRGYFQSARPATGRLLLNTNVSHGVFRFSGPVPELMKKFDLQNDMSLQALHKSLARLRARVTYLTEGTPSGKKGKKQPGASRVGEKVISGLATRFDGEGANRPRVSYSGAGPHEVQFWLREPAPAGMQADSYITVCDYFEKSKLFVHRASDAIYTN